MDEPLTVALPKGRLLAPAVELFRYLGWQPDLEGGSRQLLLTEPGPPGWPAMRFLLAKPADVPVYVEYGAADLGIAGQDVVWESGRDLYEPLHPAILRVIRQVIRVATRHGKPLAVCGEMAGDAASLATLMGLAQRARRGQASAASGPAFSRAHDGLTGDFT